MPPPTFRVINQLCSCFLFLVYINDIPKAVPGEGNLMKHPTASDMQRHRKTLAYLPGIKALAS